MNAAVVTDARDRVGISWSRRALDVVVAAVGLVVLSPLLLAVAVAIRLESRGPALFPQLRVGEGGTCFTMWKFRSMRVSSGGPEVTAPGDGRITRIGRHLRRAGIDELPQLVNVLRGEMTLVGPRPETPALAVRYPVEEAVVFRYRPGLTGPAQIRLRDESALPPGVDDVQEFYLRTIVPRRVAVDLEFQRSVSLRSTIEVLRETLAYLFN